MTVQFDSLIVEWYNGVGSWIDLTPDIIWSQSLPRGTRGINSTDISARTGGIGSLSFMLRNDEKNNAGVAGYYTPTHQNAISVNWGKPYLYPVRIKVTYEDRTKYIWYGTFETGPNGVSVEAGSYAGRTVSVSFRDWMGLAQERKLNLLPSYSSQTIDQAYQILLDQLGATEQPQGKLLRTGDSTFAAVFDDTNSGSTIFSEMAKLNQSELGYGYVKADRLTGELLVTENRNLRYQSGGNLETSISQDTGGSLLLETGDYLLLESGDQLLLNSAFKAASGISLSNAECGHLLLETGDALLNEDGGYILLNERQSADFTEDHYIVSKGLSVNYYDNAYQSARISVQQKETGTSVIVLWSMEKPLAIGANETLTGIRGRYRDPAGGSSYVNGANMVTPVITTDYLCYVNSNGTGTNLSANLTVTAEYGGAEVEYTITNSGAAGYITKLQARGYGVYSYDSLDIVLGDEVGKERLDIDLSYETDVTVGTKFANDIIRNINGSTTIQKLPIHVNKNTFTMNAFMDLDIGSLYNLTDPITAPEKNSPYFINGYEFEIFPTSDGLNIYWYLNGFPYSRVYIP